MKVIFYQYRGFDRAFCYYFDFTYVDQYTPNISGLESFNPDTKGIFITDKEKT